VQSLSESIEQLDNQLPNLLTYQLTSTMEVNSTSAPSPPASSEVTPTSKSHTFVKQISRKSRTSRRQESGLSLSDDNDSLESDSGGPTTTTASTTTTTAYRTNSGFINDNETSAEQHIIAPPPQPITTDPQVVANGNVDMKVKHPSLKKQLSTDNGFVCQYVDGKRCEISLNRENFTYERCLTSSDSGEFLPIVLFRQIRSVIHSASPTPELNCRVGVVIVPAGTLSF